MKKLLFFATLFLAIAVNAQTQDDLTPEEKTYSDLYKKFYFSKNFDQLDSLKIEFKKFEKSENETLRKSIADILKEIDQKQSSVDSDKYSKRIRQNIIKKYGLKLGTKIADGNVWIGMTKEMVKDAIGYPDNINSTETATSYSEQWVYEDYLSKELSFYYFKNGKLSAIQK